MTCKHLITCCGLIAAILLIVPGSVVHADHLRNVQQGKPVPAFSMKGIDGKDINSKDMQGKVLVLVYLSAHQRQSEAALTAAHQVVNNIGKDKLSLVYVSNDIQDADYFRLLRDRVMAHEPFAFDPKRSYYGKLGLIVLPTTIISSKDGKLLHVAAGWTRNYKNQLNAYCQYALGAIGEKELAKQLTAKPETRNPARAKADRHRSMARILRKKGMIPSAIQELEQAIAADPSYGDAVVELAEILIAEKRIDDAEKLINELLAKQPNYHSAKTTLGLIKFKRGQFDEAQKLLTEALVMNPNTIQANYYLGQLYEAKGNHKKAMEHYRDALKRCLNEQ